MRFYCIYLKEISTRSVSFQLLIFTEFDSQYFSSFSQLSFQSYWKVDIIPNLDLEECGTSTNLPSFNNVGAINHTCSGTWPLFGFFTPTFAMESEHVWYKVSKKWKSLSKYRGRVRNFNPRVHTSLKVSFLRMFLIFLFFHDKSENRNPF